MAEGRLLIVEDDLAQQGLISSILRSAGYRVRATDNAAAALRLLAEEPAQLVLSDWKLKDSDGMALLHSVRAEHPGVGFVLATAYGSIQHAVEAVRAGADDYLPKPFSPRELLARLRVHVRRARGQVGPDAAGHLLRVADLELHPLSMRATRAGQELDLTSYEFALLRVLAERAGRVLTREQLLELAKGGSEDSFERSIDIRVSRLRQKLGDDPRRPRLLKTVRGMGYMLATEQEA